MLRNTSSDVLHHGDPLAVLHFDFKKVFDSVRHQWLLKDIQFCLPPMTPQRQLILSPTNDSLKTFDYVIHQWLLKDIWFCYPSMTPQRHLILSPTNDSLKTFDSVIHQWLLKDSWFCTTSMTPQRHSVLSPTNDSSNTVDSVPHQWLLLQLEAYGINGKLLKWISSFITKSKMARNQIDVKSNAESHEISTCPTSLWHLSMAWHQL